MSGNYFVKGRTNNHLTWVMVDATDFATPESALSAATKIKIYGKLRGATGVNFVTSGTGSLTNDIQHVGASVLGMYTIALAKADLSDASAAWYDQYEISLSATGAAYQALVVDGGIDASAILANGAAAASRALLAQSFASDAYSAAAQGTSQTLLVKSLLSDVDSALTSQFTYTSGVLSDIDSALTSQFNATSDAVSNAYSAAVQGSSRALLNQSYASDAASAAREASSRVLLAASAISDIDSALTSQFNATSDAASNIYSALTSTRAEPGQGAPAATTTPLAKIDYIYKAWRNHTTQTATKYKLFNDASNVVDQSAAVSDDATTFTRAEIGTGA